ncbi:HD domain-containing phosphohydrolase [Desulfosarcina sp.]|uniref:HD domain-containing phosphohydrolase n=1 Tax=Desulfosarcina sp. TaxID=2027861 RepID=UPI00356A5B6E
MEKSLNSNMAQSPLDWQRILDAVSDGMIITDRDFKILFCNRAFSVLSGIESANLIGKKCHDVFSSELCFSADCPLTQFPAAGQQLVFDHEPHCKNGKHAPWIVTITAFPDANGSIGGYVEKFTDASAFRRVRQALNRSHDRLRKNMGAIIQAMSTTIEKRDPYTAGHQRRVTKLCRAIATQMGFTWERIQGLRMAAAIHDLGKINIPSAILNKPGPISEHELAIIQMHPRTAYEILKDIQFPWPIAETIYQHHERLDGSGYPRQLKGDQILLEARILAIADVVESIASFRPYRPELGLKAALAEIESNKGVLYDSSVVDICTSLINRSGFDFETKVWRQYQRP